MKVNLDGSKYSEIEHSVNMVRVNTKVEHEYTWVNSDHRKYSDSEYTHGENEYICEIEYIGYGL